MLLHIDNCAVEAHPDQTLLDIIKQLGFDCESMQQTPLAAKIAGEVFNLNYVPVRSADIEKDQSSIRRAMAASNGVVTLLRYGDPAGKDVFTRTSQFVLFMAIHRLWPKAKAKMNCKVGKALYVQVFDSGFDILELKNEIKRIVNEDIPLIRKSINTQQAKKLFEENGQFDKSRLLAWRKEEHFSIYTHDDFADYYYGELAPSTGSLKVWDILPAEGGFMFLYPDDQNPDQVAHYEDLPKFLNISIEGERWCSLMGCENVADLNELVDNGKIRELIRVNEALHEKRYSQIADMICQRNAKAVMLAGPSSSGKTTSANRLATQLRVH